MDAISDDGSNALTLIAFIGSVFSPYYAWSKRDDPYDHCAINIALYGKRGSRWAMTERRSSTLCRDNRNLQIGPSALRWENDVLVADVVERGAPLPFAVRGQLRITPEILIDKTFDLSSNGRHQWRPYAPRARVEIAFSEPALRWSGWGYMDTNGGSARLEDDFQSWDWSRAHFDDGSAILYNANGLNARPSPLALWIGKDGTIENFEAAQDETLPRTLWQIQRRTQVDSGQSARVIRTLEDTPFYARSTIDTTLLGRRCMAVHETLSLTRFANPVVKAMLPFRMPRVFWK